MSTHNGCGCTSEDCRVNGCLMKRQRNEAGGFYAADRQGRGGPAFPSVNHPDIPVNNGMTLRDYFAAKVCAALLTSTSADADYPNLDYRKNPEGQTLAERVAGISYRMADAMLKEREL